MAFLLFFFTTLIWVSDMTLCHSFYSFGVFLLFLFFHQSFTGEGHQTLAWVGGIDFSYFLKRELLFLAWARVWCPSPFCKILGFFDFFGVFTFFVFSHHNTHFLRDEFLEGYQHRPLWRHLSSFGRVAVSAVGTVLVALPFLHYFGSF